MRTRRYLRCTTDPVQLREEASVEVPMPATDQRCHEARSVGSSACWLTHLRGHYPGTGGRQRARAMSTLPDGRSGVPSAR
jgi:hypothetical protein